jgi:hypothetical protein
MDTFDPTNLPDTPDIPASIVASGLSDAPLTTLVEAAMQRLVASGVPIDRMNVGFRILHPLFDGMSITWTRETGAEVFYAALVDKEGSEFRVSPFYVMLSDGSREWRLRLDRDDIVGRWNVTPRVGAAWLLNASGSSVVRGGYGLFYERTPSAAGAFSQFERFTDERFADDGVTPIGPAVPFGRAIAPNLRTARSASWDLSYDYRWSPSFSIRAAMLDRRGRHELILDTVRSAESGLLVLKSDGRSRYRDVEIGAHVSRSTRFDLNATYAYARADGDLNAFAGFFDTTLWPIVAPNQYGPLSTDVPHRLFARARALPTPTWLVVAIADWRSGLPYSLVDASLDFVGDRNTERMPSYFRLDLGLEHRFRIFKLQPWIGIRAYNALNAFLLERAVEKRKVRFKDGQEVEGKRLVHILDRMVAYGKLLQMVEKRGTPRLIVEVLLRGRIKDAEAFTDKARLQELIKPLRGAGTDIVLERDEEHGNFDILVPLGTNGSRREVRVGEDLVTSPEYKALYAAYDEFRELADPPLTVVDGGETPIPDKETLVEHLLSEGKKGMAIQRFKGLGEMNAEELWETTMNPEFRTLLQVKLEDEEVAEYIFSTLMGDAVEPRRLFIEENALNVRNLDI